MECEDAARSTKAVFWHLALIAAKMRGNLSESRRDKFHNKFLTKSARHTRAALPENSDVTRATFPKNSARKKFSFGIISEHFLASFHVLRAVTSRE